MTVKFKKGIKTRRKKENVFSYARNANNYTSSDRKHFLIEESDEVTRTGNTFSKRVYPITRHPSQLYESISMLALFILMCVLFFIVYKGNPPSGLMIGLFLFITFLLRYVYEIFKESQVLARDDWALNTGQILSIPVVIIGLIFIIYSFTKGKTSDS